MSKNTVKSDASKYDKKTPREHVLLRPDTYIGDVDPTTEEMWIEKEDSIVKEKITYTPGFLKIFDEIIVNARDASINDETCDTIKVEYNKDICCLKKIFLSKILDNDSGKNPLLNIVSIVLSVLPVLIPIVR